MEVLVVCSALGTGMGRMSSLRMSISNFTTFIPMVQSCWKSINIDYSDLFSNCCGIAARRRLRACLRRRSVASFVVSFLLYL